MKYIKLGKSDLKVSVIGQGTGQFGTRAWGYGIQYDDKAISSVIEANIQSGINVFDTAETYGDGRSEILLGNKLKEYNRDDYVIITKVAPWNLAYKNVKKAANKSLERLGVNCIDLYLIHYPNPFIPLKCTLRAMEELVKDGKVRYIGVSNFNLSLLRSAQEYLSSSEIVANEIEYNLFSLRAENDLIPYCLNENICIIAYSPLAGGLLTGKYNVTNLPKDRAHAFNFYNRKSFFIKASELFTIIDAIAKSRNKKIPQIALNYVISNQNTIAIPAALSPTEVKLNADASSFELTRAELQKLKQSVPSISDLIYGFDHFVIRPISWAKESIRHIDK